MDIFCTTLQNPFEYFYVSDRITNRVFWFGFGFQVLDFIARPKSLYLCTLNSDHTLLYFNYISYKPISHIHINPKTLPPFFSHQEPIITRHCVRRAVIYSKKPLLFSSLVKFLVSVFYLLIQVVCVCQSVSVKQSTNGPCFLVFLCLVH